MQFDDSGLRKALDIMSKKASEKGKPLAVKQAYFFVNLARKISRQNAPDPIEILDVGLKLKGRLKRKPGVTVLQEIGRRISKIGTLAKGWRIWKTESDRFRIRIWIIDLVGYSKVVDDRQKLSHQAAEIVGKSFKRALDKLAVKITSEFGK